MSEYRDYDVAHFAEIFDREHRVIGADYIAGLLHVHSRKPLKDLHILDAGCGTGRYAMALTDLGVGKVSLVDASSEMLKIAKDKLKYVIAKGMIGTIIQAKFPPLPFDDGMFDAVMFNYVLQDLEKPEDKKEVSAIETTLRETKRVLRPKGLLVITTSFPELIKEFVWFTQIYRPLGEKLAKYFPTSKEWANLFDKCGFEVVSAVNSLISGKVNHFDPEGPLREEWRLGTCVYDCADDKERKALAEAILDLKEKGLLKKFMEDHDRTAVVGMTAFFICTSV